MRNKKQIDQKDVTRLAALITIIVGIIALLNVFGISSLPDLLNIGPTIDVSRCLNMTADEVVHKLKFDKVREGNEKIYFSREGKTSYLECDYDYLTNAAPSNWNMYIKEDDFSFYGIIVNKTTIEEANRIVERKGWYIEDSDMNHYDDPSIDSVEYMKGTEMPKFIDFKVDKGIVTEIRLYYFEWNM